jgi:hypothetical protein
MPPVGFEPPISAGERPQTYALDRAATETGYLHLVPLPKCFNCVEMGFSFHLHIVQNLLGRNLVIKR